MKSSFLSFPIILAAIFLLSNGALFAQKDNTLFHGIRLTGGWGGSTTALTNLGDGQGVFTGGYGGVELNKNIFLGWGGAQLINEPKIDRFANDRYDMNYNGFILGVGMQSYRSIHPQFMLLIGDGNVSIENAEPQKFFILQPSAGLELNVFRWFRVGLQGGYRMVSDTELYSISNEDLSDFYGEVRLKFGWSWGKARSED